MRRGIRKYFPKHVSELSANVGAGLRALLASHNNLEEAHHTCVSGLLADVPATVEQLRLSGLRLVQDAVGRVEGPIENIVERSNTFLLD